MSLRYFFKHVILNVYLFICGVGCVHAKVYVWKAELGSLKKEQTQSRPLEVDTHLLNQQASAI